MERNKKIREAVEDASSLLKWWLGYADFEKVRATHD